MSKPNATLEAGGDTDLLEAIMAEAAEDTKVVLDVMRLLEPLLLMRPENE